MACGVFLGLTTVDIFSYVERYPASNEKVRAGEQLIFAGGPAANASVAFSAFATNHSRLVTGLGCQPLADLARSDLRAHGVTIIDAAAESDQLPVLSCITVETTTGNRSVVYTDTGGRLLSAVPEPEVVLDGCSVLMLDGYYLHEAVTCAAAAKAKGLPVVLDGGSWKVGLERLLPFVDYALCSADFMPPGCTESEDAVRFIQELGVQSVAVSRGGDRLLYWEDDDRKELTLQDVEVVDTLGAGDILHGAFCHYILKNNFPDSLCKACNVASQSCRYRGARAWIRDLVQ